MRGFSVVLSEIRPDSSRSFLRALEQYGPVDVLAYAYDGLEASQLAVRLRPEILILHSELPGMSGFDVCRIVSQAAPEVACVVLMTETSPQIYQEAMLAGARALVTPDTKPREVYDLLQTLARAREVRRSQEYLRATDPSQAPVVIAATAPRGGCGTTTVAANLALLLARRQAGDVVLVEAAPLAAQAAEVLGVQAPGNLWDLARMAGPVDHDLLVSLMATHSSGLRLLPGAGVAEPQWMEHFTIDFVAQLLGVLRRAFRYVVLDLPAPVWDVPAYAMKRCERVLILTETRSASDARDATYLIESLRKYGIPEVSMTLVANRTSKQDPITVTELAEACGLVSAVALPNDTRGTQEALRARSPVVEHTPSSALARALEQLAKLVSEPAPPAEQAA